MFLTRRSGPRTRARRLAPREEGEPLPVLIDLGSCPRPRGSSAVRPVTSLLHHSTRSRESTQSVTRSAYPSPGAVSLAHPRRAGALGNLNPSAS